MSIKSKDLVAQAKKLNAANLAAAFKSGDEAQMAEAMSIFCSDVHDAILAQAAEDIELRNQDSAIMAARGMHPLTSAEMSYYTELTAALKAPDPRMALTNMTVGMPETVIDAVIGTIRRTHPLLNRIAFMNTAYMTRVILNAQPGQTAKWGAIGSGISQELSAAFKEVDVTLLKLTAFMAVSNDLLDLGPQWLDQYIRETLSEAIACTQETGIVAGTGNGEPIGMIRDVSSTANVQGGVYPKQTATPLTELSATALGAIVAKIARDPVDSTKARVVDDLIFLCNPFDYWKKIMPATTYRKPDGTWLRDLLPIPADIMQTVGLAEGEAVLGMPNRYFAALGVTGKNGVIAYDDSIRFLEDQRVYKAKLQGNSRPMDEFSFVLLDISNLQTELPTLTKSVDAAAESSSS